MIDINVAKLLALKAANEYYESADDEMIILEQETIEKPYGWVFFFGSRKFAETGDLAFTVGGNSPVVVLKGDGSLHYLGTAYMPDKALAELEHRLKLV